MFFTNLQLKNDILKSCVKGVEIEISKKVWNDVVGLKQRRVQVRKVETGIVEEFNKVQYYGSHLRRPGGEIKSFHVGGLKVDERLLVMTMTKMIVPCNSNHSTLNEGDWVLMYCIHNKIYVDWTFALCDHMMKAKRLTDFNLPYVMLISKFIEYLVLVWRKSLKNQLVP